MRKTKPTIRYRRKRQGKTNYNRRLVLLKSNTPRLVIRISTKYVIIQGVEYTPDGDKIIFSCHSRQLKKFGWKTSGKNIPAAYLTGYLCGKKSKGFSKRLLLDANKTNITKGSRIYAALKGAIDSGLKVAASPEIFPSQERVSGKHIAEYAKKIKGTDAYNKQFSSCLKLKFNPEDIQKQFEEVKQNIDKNVR